MTIDWASLGQERFDRTVEVLLRDRFGPRVRAVNGKGGDGGVGPPLFRARPTSWWAPPFTSRCRNRCNGAAAGPVERRPKIGALGE